MNRKNPVLATTLILAGLLTAGTAQAQAQRSDRPWHPGPRGAEEQLVHLDQALDLTDEQSLQMLELLQAAEAEREDLHTRAMESFQPEICALRQNTEAEILSILTPEQAAAFQQLQEERAHRRQGRRGPMPDCPNADG